MTMRSSYIERPLLGSDGELRAVRTSLWRSPRTLMLCVLFGSLFCALLAANLYQNALRGVDQEPMIRLRSREFEQSAAPTLERVNNSELFHINSRDVMVFLQIQNAGANFFERHIVEDIDLDRPCSCHRKRKQCTCLHPHTESTWLFSRITSGWKCGVHPDWTVLTSCVDRILDEDEGEPVKRRYFYITMLRDPVRRFRTEWLRYTSGKGSRPQRHLCGGHETTLPDVTKCFKDRNPKTVSLEEFANCSTNLAINRQTRMLADLRLVNCYSNDLTISQSQKDMLLLHSAKNNLHKMAFFGLAEFPNVSQRMFESSFNLRFVSQPHKKFNRLSKYLKNTKRFSTAEDDLVRKANYLDVDLYEYAKELLFQRFSRLKKLDPYLHDKEDNEAEDPDWADGDDLFTDR